uniref:EGF-like domain-containing protein n=1 Tax=Branchiostoma floridae TaxID=7739 RepID=C3XPB0_BRAFL|eukprot:XP_002613772.1 hypothetical protein BRAFLDRAFT_85313 [Branchiostoma floridae]
MATTETTTPSEQEHAKGEDVGVTKPSSKLQQALHEDDVKAEGVTAPKISSEHQTSVPNEYKSSPAREKRKVKEKVSSAIAEEDHKIRSKAADRGKHAYDQTIVGEQAESGQYGSAPGVYTDLKPAAVGPRYLHVGDHVVVCSGHESEHTFAYREAEEVSEGCKEDHCSHYSTIPEGAYGYKVPEEVNNAYEEEFCSNSHDYDKPEDAYGYKDPQGGSFAYRAKERVAEMWSEWKSSKVCWLGMGCGLLFIASVVIAGIMTHFLITSDGRVTLASKLQQNGTLILDSSTPAAIDEVIVIGLIATPTYLPFKNSSVTANALPLKVTFLSTTAPYKNPDYCAKKPCQHGGHCVNKDGGYKCTCSPGWTGQNCQEGESFSRVN